MEFILNILYESYQYFRESTLLFDQQFLKYIGQSGEQLIMYQLLSSCHNIWY